jgi:uncharacterized protein (TIGR03086 family)
MAQLDLHPAAREMARLVEGVPDDLLDGPTPCADLPLRGLLDHVGGFAVGLAATARKEHDGNPPPAPTGDLEPGWRQRIATDLAGLADAWAKPEAWEGMTKAGSVDLPGEVGGRVAFDELVVHAWDVARSTGQTFECDEAWVAEVEATVRGFRGGNDGDIPGLFGPAVPVPDDAPPLDRLLGITGRDPRWSPS